MCRGREGSSGCAKSSSQDSGTMDKAWLWVVLVVSLWLGLMLTIWVLRICSHRQRRYRFLNKVIAPMCAKLGVKVTWGDPALAEERRSEGARGSGDVGGRVFYTSGSSSNYPTHLSPPPPPYDIAIVYNNAYTSLSLSMPLSPPSYEQSTAMKSTSTSLGPDVTTTSEDNDVTTASSPS